MVFTRKHSDMIQIFNADIKRLLAMDDMWKVPGRVRPVPLDYANIVDRAFVNPPLRDPGQNTGSSTGEELQQQMPHSLANGHADGSTIQTVITRTNGHSRTLKDQHELSVKENLMLFIDRWDVSIFSLRLLSSFEFLPSVASD